MQIRAERNKIENINTIEKLNKTELFFFSKINTSDS